MKGTGVVRAAGKLIKRSHSGGEGKAHKRHSTKAHVRSDSTKKMSRLGSVEEIRESKADEMRDSELAALTTTSPVGRRRVHIPFENPKHRQYAEHMPVPGSSVRRLRNRLYNESVSLPSEVLSRQSMYQHQARENDMVQFDSVEVIAYEYEETVSLIIERIGRGQEEITLRYNSKDVNLGKQYRKFEGTVVMKPGQFEAQLDVPLVYNTRFTVEGMMSVFLEVAKGAASVGDADTVR